jgi:hypothetical protein
VVHHAANQAVQILSAIEQIAEVRRAIVGGGVSGISAAAVMQPWDKTLTDQRIADVLTYERSEWGNNASAVTAEQIAALRKELANHPASFTEPDLLGVPADAELSGGAPAGAPPLKPGEPPKPGAITAAPPKT